MVAKVAHLNNFGLKKIEICLFNNKWQSYNKVDTMHHTIVSDFLKPHKIRLKVFSVQMSASFNLSLHGALCRYEYVLLFIFYFILFCTWTRIFRQKEKNRQEKENERQIEKEKDRQIEKEKEKEKEKERTP